MIQKCADYLDLDALRAGENTDQFVYNSTAQKPADKLQALIDQLGEKKVLMMLEGKPCKYH